MARSLSRLATFGGVALLAFCVATAQAVVVVDLTPSDSTTISETADLGGTVVLTNALFQSTGTGVISPFLRIQQNGQERGYNTSLGFPLDDKHPDNFTHALALSDIPIINIGGTDYREFLLDANQQDNGNISLNQVQIFQSSADVGASGFTLQEADATHNAVIGPFGVTTTQVFRLSNRDLSAATAYEVLVDSDHGSGSGDMFLYVPNTDFNTSLGVVTLFSQFGLPPGTTSSDDGFEEWATRTVTTAIPEPLSIIIWSLMGLGGAGLAVVRRRKTLHLRPEWSPEARASIRQLIDQGQIH